MSMMSLSSSDFSSTSTHSPPGVLQQRHYASSQRGGTSAGQTDETISRSPRAIYTAHKAVNGMNALRIAVTWGLHNHVIVTSLAFSCLKTASVDSARGCALSGAVKRTFQEVKGRGFEVWGSTKQRDLSRGVLWGGGIKDVGEPFKFKVHSVSPSFAKWLN